MNNFNYDQLKPEFTFEEIQYAYNIAQKAANEMPPSYYCAGFEPHAWVVRAILLAIKYEKEMSSWRILDDEQ